MTRARILVSAAVLMLVFCADAGARSARFEVVNLDGPGEGLNDSSAFAPVGGNEATTLGAARWRVVEMAAAMWAQSLSSPVTIRIGVSFDSLGGTPSSATLAHGGPEEAFRDFSGAPTGSTWYVSSLADRLAGVDLSGGTELDVTLVVNVDVDGDVVLGDASFYYGLDHEPPSNGISLLAVVAHELAHGLGFGTYTSRATGVRLLGFNDAFLLKLERRNATPSALALMTDVERIAAFRSTPDLVWSGSSLTAEAAERLAAGLSPEGRVRMYAPLTGGSSAGNHFDTAVNPGEILEPFYDQATELDFCLTLAALADLGWGSPAECPSLVTIGESSFVPTTQGAGHE